jgi:surface protein
MSNMFAEATVFNENIGNWATDNVVNMRDMFAYATAFNQDISGWHTGNVTATSAMFQNAESFNQDLSGWDMSSNQDMVSMFDSALVFNSDISGWDVSHVVDFTVMFWHAEAFDQNLGGWVIPFMGDGTIASGYTSGEAMFGYSGLSCYNYTATLNGWAANPATPHNAWFPEQYGRVYDTALVTTVPGSFPYAIPKNGRDSLINVNGWDDYNGTTVNASTYSTFFNDNLGVCGTSASLPVSLIGFTAQAQSNHTVLLHWATASEHNNYGFAVQRSTDGTNWTTIGFVNSKAANGNSVEKLDYTYIDNNDIVSPVYYYRLKQTDYDGKITYSSIREVKFGTISGGAGVRISPNPAKGMAIIDGLSGGEAIGVYTLSGQLIREQKNTGKNLPLVLSVARLPAGVYVIRITQTNGKMQTLKLIVQP